MSSNNKLTDNQSELEIYWQKMNEFKFLIKILI